MVKYYPKVPNFSQLIKQNLEIGWTNEEAKVRLQDIEDRKARGKGAPKKAKSEDDSRRKNRTGKKRKSA